MEIDPWNTIDTRWYADFLYSCSVLQAVNPFDCATTLGLSLRIERNSEKGKNFFWVSFQAAYGSVTSPPKVLALGVQILYDPSIKWLPDYVVLVGWTSCCSFVGRPGDMRLENFLERSVSIAAVICLLEVTDKVTLPAR